MKIVLTYICALLLSSALIQSSSLHASENDWGIEIELSKQTYILHEPILLDVTLTNLTSDTLRTYGLDTPNHLDYWIELRDGTGALIEHTGVDFEIADYSGRLLLEAGEQYYGCANVLDLFGLRESRSGYRLPRTRFPYIPKGTYTVQVRFEESVSNVLTFEVIEPFGDEKMALEMIVRACSLWTQANPEPSSQAFREVINSYPNSVYAEQCYYLSYIYSQAVKDARADGTFRYNDLYKVMLVEYPDSDQSRSWLVSIYHRMDDKGKAMNIINRCASDTSDTRSAKFARQILRQLEKMKQEGGQ